MKNVYFNSNDSLVTLASPNQTGETLPRDYRKGTINSLCRNLTLLFAVLVMSVANIGMAWGTDFDITLDQFRTTPVSGLVKIDNSNLSMSGGKLQLSSGNKDFTISTTNTDYKIKKVVFSTTKAVIKYGGDAIEDNTFTPATPGTSFTLNLAASGGTANITQMVVTLTTSTSEILEELEATALADGVYTTGSSEIIVSTEGGSQNSSPYRFIINKSSSTRSLTIATSASYNLKFIALNYYDAIFSRSISASTGTYTPATYIWAPGSTPTNTVTLTFNTENSEAAKIRKIYVGYESVSSGCTSYSFHYGIKDAEGWTTECFVTQGEDHEMQIEDFTIPSTTHFYVGKNSEFHGTTGNASDANSSTVTWSSMYFAHSAGDGSRPMVGQATGATGTIRIYDNSTWTNKQAAFIPDGYKLKIGSTEYPFAVYSGNEFRSDLVEMSSSNARSNISVGITNGSGGYVATDNTQEMQHLFLNTGGTSLWSTGNASNFAIYDDTDGHKYFTCLMTKVPGEDYLYEGWVPSSCTKVIFCRMASTTLEWGADNSNVWNYVPSMSLEANKNLFTISSWSNGTWSAYEKSGKFRMNRDWTDKNWYVRFVPYHVLHYDANGGSGAPADQSVAADASPCQLTVSATEPTRTDYVFQGWNPTKATADAGTIDGAWDPSDTHAMTGDVTLYAVWTACSGPSITAEAGMAGQTYSVGDAANTITITASAGNGGTLHYHWYQYNVGQNPLTQSIDAVGGTDANTYTPSTASAHEGQIFYCVVSEEGCSTTVQSAYSGAITVNGVATPIITYNIKVTGSGTTIKGDDATTTDGTNISTLSITETNAGASGDPTGSNRSTKIAIKTGANGADWSGDPTNYVEFKYKVACGKKLTPSKIHIPVANVGSASANNIKYKAVMSDKFGHTLSGTYVVATQNGTVENFDINNADASKFFQGEVTLKLWAWTIASQDNGGSAFRMGTPVTIFGEVATQATPAATIIWDTHPADGAVGDDDVTIAAHASDGSTVSYTSNNVAVATIVAGKVHYVAPGTTTIQASITDVCGNTVNQNSNSFTVSAADCKVSLSKVVLTSTSTGTVTGYNDKEFAGDAVIGGLESTQTAEVDASHDGDETGYKLSGKGSAIVFATLKGTSFQPGDVVKVTITKKNDMREIDSNKEIMTIYYGTNSSDAAALVTLTGVSGAGTYSYTLTAANITTIGSKKGIGVFRESSNGQNHYVYSVEIVGCREHATVYAFSNGSFTDWGTCNGGTLTLSGSQSGVSYQLYKDGTASGDAKAGTGSALNWTVTASGTYTVKSVANASYAETAMTGSAVVTLQDPTLSGESSVAVGSTITLTHPGYLIGGGSWATSDGSVATVTDGVVTGVAAGTATITFHGVGACDGSKLITVTAPITYTVTYNGNSAGDGTVPVDGTSYSSGATVTVLGNTGSLTRTIEGSAATFYGWNTNSSGYGGTHYEAGNTFSITANTTLYAEWGFPITYNTDGGTINDLSYPTHYIYTGSDDCTTAALPTNVTKAGYTFDGWYTVNGSGSKVTCIEGTYIGAFAGDYALKAKWSEADGCEELVNVVANSATTVNSVVGTGTVSNPSSQSNPAVIKLNSSGYVELTPKSGESFAAGDKITVVIYNQATSTKTTGFRLADKDSGTAHTTSIAQQSNETIEATLVAADITDGKVKIFRYNSDGWFVSAKIEHCEAIPSCTTPIIPSLSDQTVCPGSDIAAWNATVSNAAAITAAGEDVAYSWKKKGSDTELATTASFDLGSSATESQAGTYVVKVTVSKAGCANATASAEVDLTVTPATEEPSISSNKAKVYAGDAVTLTATCGSTGITWEWYQCSDAVGTITGSKLSSTNSYTISSAPTAGTYYYKAVAKGDGTNSCGDAEYVYTLTVSAPSECETHVWWEEGAPTGEVQASCFTFGATPTGSKGQSASMTIDGTTYNSTKRSSDWNSTIQFTVPADATATFYICGEGTGARTITLTDAESHTSTFSMTTTFGTFHSDEIGAGTWTMTTNGNLHIGMVALHVCVSSTCTDAVPTATAANTTVCSGSELSITATGYEESPVSIQWQKLNGSTWDNISGATEATYTVASATSENAGSYRVVVTKGCARTSNTVTIAVPSAPVFGDVPASVSVMQTIALSINTVEATDAAKYRWYKSADATWDAGDTEIGTNKELIKAYDGEAIGNPSYYIFCRAQNACGITTSTAIAVNVTAYVEEDCATRGNEGDAEFSFENSGAGQGSYESTACWTMNSNSKILVYYPPTGKYFKTAKVTIASSSENKASYNWSTNGGTDYTAVSLTVNSTLTERTINLSTHGNVDAFQIGRNFDSKGSSGGTLYVSRICFEYTEACTATTVTPSTSSVNYEMGGAWSNPTFTLSVAGTLTYSSSNEDIASVDDDGTVTFNGEAGTVTITASYAGGTISETEYCASSGSYTINVSCPGGAPKIEADGSTDMVGCNTSVTLHAKTQDGTAFADGTYQWFRNGTEIDGATSSSYIATQAGTYTVERTSTSDCTTPSTNSAIVTSETTEPEVERLVPFQYYHVDKTYSDQMKMRHLFAVKNSGTLDGKHFKMYVSRNGGAATDVTNSNALVVWPNGDGHVDTVMVDLNKLSGKYSENDELVFTCKAIDCSSNISDVYKNTITMRVIGTTPTLALICSGSDKASGTRKTGELTVGGDFITGYNKADLCEQTGNTSFDASTEWGLYTRLKANYIVTPVNGYAVFNKLNYEPFDILLLTDYPKSKKSEAAQKVIDDMADLCDYRPLLSFKTHFRQVEDVDWDIDLYTKWVAKGFTTAPVADTKNDGKLNLNIVCYAHPMFEAIKTGADVYEDAENTSAPLVYKMLTGEGYEKNKGMQGFEIAAAENFVTIGLTHHDAAITYNSPLTGEATWSPNSGDRMLVTVAERQANIEARMILFSLNAGAQSKLTDKGELVVLKCLEYLLDTDPLHVADCSFTFDNGAGINKTQEEYKAMCPSCSGTIGDHKWSTQGNWGPDYRLLPGEYTAVRIVAPVTVDMEHAHVREVRIKENGQITIPAGKALEIVGTIRRLDGTEISPTENSDITIGSSDAGNGTLIFNNDKGDTKARVDMYSNAQADITNMSAATSVWQYIGTPHTDVANARSNYYGSWLYQYVGGTWKVIPNGGPLVAFRGYCITNETAPIVYDMEGTLAATTTQDIAIPAGYTVIANSWVAPIDISTFTDDDMENISDKTIYFFNTGTDADGNHGTGTAPGTYVAVPKNSASYVGTWQIPSMQGFYISTTSAGTLHLDYDRHVRPAGDRTIVGNKMYAPRRAAAESDEPNVLKIFARGSRYQDKLVVLEREDFTRGYDSGWDGEAWGGSDLSPMVYVTGEGREDAVSAIPEFEGTVIAFKAGEDNDYHFEFVYSEDAEPLYLFDTENNTYTQIMTGNAYYFTTTDKAPHSRFILTRRGPQIETGIEPTSDGESAKARKLLIEDKMYILLNGMLYDATGKVVK